MILFASFLLTHFFFYSFSPKVTHPTLLVGQSVHRSPFGQWPLLLLLLLLHPPPLNLSFKAQIPVSRPKSQSQGPNPSLEAQILASRPKS